MALSVIQYVGGKGTHLSELLPLIPYGRGYCEPYGGGASLLLNRRRSEVEVYNDLNGDIVNIFEVMRDPELWPILEEMLAVTMFSKGQFQIALKVSQDPMPAPDDGLGRVHRAWATYVIHNMGISGKLHRTDGNWSRSKASSGNTERWWRRFERLTELHDRMKFVQIDAQDALGCIRYWDDPSMVFYVDPPYVLSTRGGTTYYAVEQDDDHHQELVETLLGVRGAVVLSGYDHPIYEPLTEAGWIKDLYSKAAIMTVGEEGKPKRVECVWRNERGIEMGGAAPLFL